MAEYTMSIINTALAFCADLWTHLIQVTGMWGYYFAAMLGLLLLRYLLAPIFGRKVSFGAGSSDTADKSRSSDEED